ncbi:unnamed protein product [Arabidopsis lyrata]|nr:unnamed protein product [Arabidopsis lyrata]
MRAMSETLDGASVDERRSMNIGAGVAGSALAYTLGKENRKASKVATR